MVDHLACGEIDHFDPAVLPGSSEELLAVVRDLDMPRRSSLKLNVIDDFLLRFVDDENLLGPAADVEQSLCVRTRNRKEKQTASAQRYGDSQQRASRHSVPPLWQENSHTSKEIPDRRSASL